jgi:hypothetical protein
VLAGVKTSIKAVLRPPIHAGWPAVEYAARLLPGATTPKMRTRWSSSWNREFDDALKVLPQLEECPASLYRELVKSGSVPKLHALVTEDGDPTAVISLRRCLRRWEPVAYQCIPKVISPAVGAKALGRALNGLGVEVRVSGGIGPELADLNPRQSWTYQWYKVDLQDDFEAYWHAKKRMYTIRRARKRCAEMECSVDGAGDLEWIVQRWHDQWRDDPGNEIVATEDRLRFWGAMMSAPGEANLRVHTMMLRDGARRVAGVVFTTMGDSAMLQCGGRDPEFDDSYTAAATHLSIIDWAAANGFKTLDLAGGDWKRHWGPVGGVRHGAYFRSPVIDALAWAN